MNRRHETRGEIPPLADDIRPVGMCEYVRTGARQQRGKAFVAAAGGKGEKNEGEGERAR